MLHIAEDRLHAFVDRDRSGLEAEEAASIESHLARCAECRAVVEEGLLYRSRAGGILARSGPPRVVAPDFAEIQMRAGGPAAAGVTATTARKSPPPMRRSYVALAWAASLIAALGLGWLTRDLFRERDQVAVEMSSEAGDRGEPASTVGPAAADARAMAESRDLSGAGAPPPSVGPAGPAVAGETPILSGAPAAKVAESPTAFGGPVTASGGAAATIQDASGSPGAAAGRPEAASQSIEPQSAPTAVAGSAMAARRGPETGAAATQASPPAAPLPESFNDRVAQAPTVRRAEREQAAAAPVAAPAPPPAAVSAQAAAPSGAAWAVVTRQEAERRYGSPILTIPDLPIQRIEVLGAPPGTVVRVTQATVSGELVMLTQARSESGVLSAGAAGVTRTLGSTELAIEGPLPAGTLRALIDSVR